MKGTRWEAATKGVKLLLDEVKQQISIIDNIVEK